MEMDLLNVDPQQEEHLHKLKRLVQNPNSFFMDVKCKECHEIATIFSHSQTSVSVYCDGCEYLLCTTTGGKAKLVVGTSYRRKGDWVANWLISSALIQLPPPFLSWLLSGQIVANEMPKTTLLAFCLALAYLVNIEGAALPGHSFLSASRSCQN